MRSGVIGGAVPGWLAAASLACGGEAPEAAPGGGAEPRGGNLPPAVREVVLEPATPRLGERVTARVEAVDPEGDAVTLEYRWWIGGRELDAKGPSIQVGGARRGDAVEVEVVARDASADSEPETATAHIGNLPPTLLQVDLAPAVIHAGGDVIATPRASDPEGDEIEFGYRWWVNGSEVDVEGATLPAGHFARGDRIEIEVTASDGQADAEPLRSAPIEVANAPPRITSTPGPLGADGVLRYAVEAVDPDGDGALRYRLLEGPAGMTVGAYDGRLEWAPGPKAGRHKVAISVEDADGASTVQTFVLDLSLEDPA
jgi:hypothetical protein